MKELFENQSKQEAAMKIQRFWRKSRRFREKIALRALEISEWKGLIEISQRNDEITEKLRKLRISKRYDVERFETLMRLPAREVNRYMEDEMRKSDENRITDEDRFARKIEEERTDRAARILQRYFRKIQIHQKDKYYYGKIQKIKPRRRLELLENINHRLNERRMLRRIRADDVLRALDSHREKMRTDKWLVKIMVDVNRHNLNLSRPNSPTNFVSRSIPPFVKHCAHTSHLERMKQIEIEDIGYDMDAQEVL